MVTFRSFKQAMAADPSDVNTAVALQDMLREWRKGLVECGCDGGEAEQWAFGLYNWFEIQDDEVVEEDYE